MAEALKLGSGGADGTARVVEAYGQWAADSNALEARRLLLATLFKEQDMATKLSGVLAALEADPTPVEKDPLWADATDRLSQLWKGDIVTKALDLVLAEKRPRARRALISSFAQLAASPRLKELTPDQRQSLTETMIDVTAHMPPSQKPEMDKALRALGGNDLADILAGKVGAGHELESDRAYKESLEQTKRELAQQQK